MAPWAIEYYSETVQDEIRRWPAELRAHYVHVTQRIEAEGPDLGMPLTRALGQGLFELRCRGREGIGRALFCTRSTGRVMILRAFIKKTQRTPRNELDLARKRQKEVGRRADA